MPTNREIGGFALLIGGLLLALRRVGDETSNNVIDFITRKPVGEGPVIVALTLDDIYAKWGAFYNVNPNLLKALAIVESSERPNVKNPADPSYGLMQIFCQSNGNDSPCTNRFNIVGWDQATPNRLLEPNFNVQLGAQIIAWNIETYGFKRGIAVYNRWASRLDPPDGPFGNDTYVSKVLGELASIEGFAF